LIIGEVAEWLKAHAWKACIGETLSWVRIPFSPPLIFNPKMYFLTKKLKIEIFEKKSKIYVENEY
tara:strand:- start:155 stop:349 length:195 start_codon:yes stop_codon:yes gene_type:complete